MLQGAREAGFEPQLAFESTEPAADQGDGRRAAWASPAAASDAEHQGLPVAAVPVRKPALARDVTLAWRAKRRHSPAARAFLHLSLTADATGAPPPLRPAGGRRE